jgi:hypothetical protein
MLLIMTGERGQFPTRRGVQFDSGGQRELPPDRPGARKVARWLERCGPGVYLPEGRAAK